MQQRWGGWGIPIFAAWALVLALVAVARLLLLSKAVELTSNEFGTQTQVWLIFIFNAIFAIGFAGSTYGLWGCHRWGRLIFLWLIGLWSGFNLAALLLAPDSYSGYEFVINILRLLIGLLVSVWYFNIPRIKAIFLSDSPDKLTPQGYDAQ